MSASGYLLEQPMVIQGTKEEAAPGIFGNANPLQFIPSMKNYADDEKTAAFFRDEIAPVMRWTRQDRSLLEAKWEETRAMNAMIHDSGRRYFGRSDSYLPIYRREKKKLVSTLSRGLFPSDEYFDCIDLETGDPERAKPVKYYMKWELEQNARLRSFMKPFLGCLVDNGTSVMKTWYKKKITSEGTGKRGKLKDLMQMQYGFKEYCKEGMVVSPRQLMYWYIYPSTCESLDDAMMVFEDLEVPIAFVEYMKNSKRWINCDAAIASDQGEQIPEHENAKWNLLNARGEGLSVPGRGGQQSHQGSILSMTEVWTYMPLPADAYLPYEDKRLPVPVLVTSLGGGEGLPTVVSIRRNPFFHQKSPYDVARMDWEQGLFYGSAHGKTIRPLQLLANDFMNQTNDNGIMGLNPIAIMDVNKMVGGANYSFFPGAPWYTLGTDAIKFDRPPIDQVQMGQNMTNQLMGMAQDFGGAAPDYGSKTRAGNTATGMQIAQKNTQGPLQDDVQDIEGDMMVPMITKAWKNAVQYRDGKTMVSVAGQMIEINPELLGIDAQFMMIGSTQAMNAQVRAQQAQMLIQAVAPLVPGMMQQGYIVDFVSLVRKIYVDGLGFRGFNEFIRKAQAAPQPGMPRPDQMGGVQGQQQDNLRSAMAQVNGAFDDSASPVDGEAQDFTDVRNQADQLAATSGGYNNQPGQ